MGISCTKRIDTLELTDTTDVSGVAADVNRNNSADQPTENDPFVTSKPAEVPSEDDSRKTKDTSTPNNHEPVEHTGQSTNQVNQPKNQPNDQTVNHSNEQSTEVDTDTNNLNEKSKTTTSDTTDISTERIQLNVDENINNPNKTKDDDENKTVSNKTSLEKSNSENEVFHNRIKQIITKEDREKVAICWTIIEEQKISLKPMEPKPDLGWKTVRLFVSSTFNDFFYEREILVKKVFPELREWCETRHLYLVECDLRWGVPRDTTTRDTISTCLEELDRCHDDNDGQPFFLNMLSHRYGWVPDALPADMTTKYDWVPGVSITTMENLHGAYRCSNQNAVFFLRQPDFLSDLPPDSYPQYYEDSSLAQLHLLYLQMCEQKGGHVGWLAQGHHREHYKYTPDKTLKHKLKEKFPSQVYEYGCKVVKDECTPGDIQIKIDNLEEFARLSLDFFKGAIDRMYPDQGSVANLTEYELENQLQKLYMEQKSEMFVGRKEELAHLLNYSHGVGLNSFDNIAAKETTNLQREPGVERGNHNLMLQGDMGCGKTALLAAFAKQALQEGMLVFYHFVGVSSNSFMSDFILRKLLMTVLQASNIAKDIPEDRTTLCQVFNETLASPEVNKVQLLIILDGLEEILTREDITNLSWIPGLFPPSICCVISVGEDQTMNSFTTELPALALRLGLLSTEESHEIVTMNLARFNKRLDPTQLNHLLSNPCSSLPLWLVTVCEELRVFGRFEKVTDRVTSLPDSLHGLLGEIIQRLLSEDETQCMETALCLINCCVKGFPMSECLHLLGNRDSNTPAPLMDWAKVRRLLKPYLRTVVVRNEERVFFFHRTMQKAVSENLVQKGEEQKWPVFLLDYMETHCTNTEFIRAEILDYYMRFRLVDRMMKFLRSNVKAQSLSEHQIRFAVQKFRCIASISSPGPQAIPLSLCVGCKMKRGKFSTRNYSNDSICLICTKWIPQNFASSQATLCMGHGLKSGHPPGAMVKCYSCKMPVAGKTMMAPVKICSLCDFGRPRCCYVGDR